MSVTQYIGARYVPLFADPLDWDINSAYEPLTIVYHQGNSYTSRQSVPKGIDITNDFYWAITGNYNAQIEQYRREVQAFDGRITENAQAIADEVTARMAADESIQGIIATLATKTELNNAVAPLATKAALQAETTARTNADTALNGRIDALEAKKYLIVIGDSFSASTQTQTPLWHTIYAAEKNLNVYTNASDGMGFVVGGNNNFSAQIDKAFAVHPNNVAEVVILGGLNDFADSSVGNQTFGDAVRTTTQKAIEKWPNAFVTVGLMAPFQYAGWAGGTSVNLDRWENFWADASYKICFTKAKLIDMRNIGLFAPGYFGAENAYGQRHPSDIGSKMIANVLLGGSIISNSYISADNCPLLAQLNGSGNNCSYSYSKGFQPNGKISFNFTLDFTNPNSDASIPIKYFPNPLTSYIPVLDSSGKAKMAYISNWGTENQAINIPAFGASNPCYFSLNFTQM